MGLSTKKTKSTTNQNTTATTTPINPTFVSEGIEGLAGKIGSTFNGLAPKSLVAPANPLQTMAGANAAGLGTPTAFTSAQNYLQGAGSAGPQKVDSVDTSGYISKFFNPYQKDVIDTSLADYDYGAGMTRAQNKLALAGDSTFGGSGGAIQTALSEDNLTRGRGALSAGLRSEGYDKALSAAQQQAAMDMQARMATANFGEQAATRGLSAGNALTALGAAQGASDRENIATQAGVGAQLRDVAQQEAQAPITTLLQQIAAFSGLPLDLLRGSTSTGTMSGTSTTKQSGVGLSDWLNFFAANAAAAAKAGGGA